MNMKWGVAKIVGQGNPLHELDRQDKVAYRVGVCCSSK